MNKPATGTGDLSSVEDVFARYEPVIGLEVHCQLRTESKLFCACSTRFGAAPNTQTCPVCLGMPGVLPVLNQKAVDDAVRMALAVGARINGVSVFARKQYFYPDLPKGYQITQYDLPYSEGGLIRLASGKEIRLIRIHLEEDAGKNVHGGEASFVDINRAGMPLMEIVSHPCLASAEEAAEYLKRLRSLVRHLGVSDGNLEEGSFRCDANVSIRPLRQQTLGTRCEIKNLNSFRNIERAIWYEIHRQAEILDAGGSVAQQTLLFDPDSGTTQAMRSKADSHDYRYFPDPDLRPLVIDEERIERLRRELPELPEAMAQRFKEQLELPVQDAALLTSDRDLAAYFEQTLARVGATVTPKVVANWITGELLREVNERQWSFASSPLTSSMLAELLTLLGEGTISGKIAKTVFQDMVETGERPQAIIEKRGLIQVSDEGAIRALVQKIVAANPAQLEQYLAGKEKLMGFFVGQIMRESQGKMNPTLVNQILKDELEAHRRG